MADKSSVFFFYECTARWPYFTVPSRRRGASQMASPEINKTGVVAKARILLEQMLRCLTTQ